MDYLRYIPSFVQLSKSGKDKRKKQIPDIAWMFQAQNLRDII